MDFSDLPSDAGRVLSAAGPAWYVGVPTALALLVVLALLLRRWARGRTMARRVTTLATVLGLGWTAQGMWDAAVHSYGVAVQVASILFIVFEAMLISNMLKAHEYRAVLDRRGRFVRAVWVIAAVMGLVVAFGEGWGQAPLRLSVPLLVAYSWWLDLTADDDPDARPETSLRWTPREIGLRMGILRLTDADRRDPTEADRRYLADRLARLAFAQEHGAVWISMLLRRPVRLARLKLDADAAMLTDVRARLELSRRPLGAADPPPPARLPAPLATPVQPLLTLEPKTPPGETRPQGWHRRPSGSGIWLRGAELEADAVASMAHSVRTGNPLSNDQLAGLYVPTLKPRKAQEYGAKGRSAALDGPRLNGRMPSLAPTKTE